MKGREIREDQRVARYVRPRLVHSTGHADPEAFVLRTRDDGTPEDGLSVNWLDAFPGGTRSQLEEVTRYLRLRVTRNGRFAEFVVGDLMSELNVSWEQIGSIEAAAARAQAASPAAGPQPPDG